MTDEDARVDQPTHVQVVRGEPDDVELAALVAGLAAAGANASDEPPAPPPNAWTDRSRALHGPAGPRAPIAPSPDAWRWSLRG